MGTVKQLITKPIKAVLTKIEDGCYEKQLAKRRISYDTWVREREQKLDDGGELTESSDIAIFHMPWGRPSEHAKALIYRYFAEHPEVQILYGDEDVWQCGERSHPWYKPDWSPDLFDRWYYFGSVVAIRGELLEKYPISPIANDDDRSFVSDVRKLLEACGAWQQGCKAVGHIPEILFHCNSVEDLNRYMTWKNEMVCQVAGSDNDRTVTGIRQSLSIIIPSKDNPDILETCIKAIIQTEKNINYEIIIVDNGSSGENRLRIEQMVSQYGREERSFGSKLSAIKYIYTPMEFNFSRMCNLGAENASGELLLFLNDDVQLAKENCLSELAALAKREYTGAVGLKLYYPESERIQHAGITNLPMGPVHKLQFLEDTKDYYFGTNRGLRNVLAVTAACLMVEKKKFVEVEGFAEVLQVAFNDVDFCFKLHEKGYFNVCHNELYAYHHESLSRGDDESTEKWQRLLGERDLLYRRHPGLEAKDPYYGVGLGREGLDTRVRPAFETAGNVVQEVNVQSNAEQGFAEEECAESVNGRTTGVCQKQIERLEISAHRQDNCLMLRVENCRQGILQGYGVVLGDDNACYEKAIILEAIETTEGTEPRIYAIFVEGQYRPDLVENMSDQTNVGLSGFWMQVVGKGSYRIGMTARNRVTGLKLINWSSRIFTVE